MFKLYECGCIGFDCGDTEDGRHVGVLCVSACDGDDRNDIAMFWRNKLHGKPWRPLTTRQLVDLLDDIAELVNRGHMLHELSGVLGRIQAATERREDDDGIAEWRRHVAMAKAQRQEKNHD